MICKPFQTISTHMKRTTQWMLAAILIISGGGTGDPIGGGDPINAI
jgi:hypothetical protein